MDDQTYRLDRILVIEAHPDIVFSFLSESDRWAQWWGTGSSIDPRPGGRVVIRHANGVETLGDVLEVRGREFIAFTYGSPTGKPIPLGGSTVRISLEAVERGTRLHLTHHFADEAMRNEHVQGWRFQLSLFSNLVTNLVQAGAEQRVDQWFTVWTEPDEAARRTQIAAMAIPGVRFRDQYSTLDGIDDLVAHIGAALVFMPGVRLTRDGQIRHCQGAVLAEWIMTVKGEPRGRGHNVFTFNANGLIESVTGFWTA